MVGWPLLSRRALPLVLGSMFRTYTVHVRVLVADATIMCFGGETSLSTSWGHKSRNGHPGVYPWFPSQLSNIVVRWYSSGPPWAGDLLLDIWRLLELALMGVPWAEETLEKGDIPHLLHFDPRRSMSCPVPIPSFKTKVYKNIDCIVHKDNSIYTGR